MSKYAEIEREFKNEKMILESLTECGYKSFEVVTDGIVNGYNTTRTHFNGIVVRNVNGNMLADIAFERQPNGSFKVTVDDLDQKSFESRFFPTYSRNVAIQKIKSMGYQVVKDVRENGTIKILARRW